MIFIVILKSFSIPVKHAYVGSTQRVIIILFDFLSIYPSSGVYIIFVWGHRIGRTNLRKIIFN